MSREIFQTLAKRQAEGVMFHSAMADYYEFLNLEPFRKFHHCQFIKESEEFRKIKDFYINYCHKTLRLENITPIEITPADWDNKTSMDVDKETIKTLTKKSLMTYLDWETETERIYRDCANKLFDMEYYDSYSFVRELVDEVETEKSHITSIILDLQSVDYDINAIKGFSYKMKY